MLIVEAAFSLMSYNILAPCYCDTTRYYHCPEYALLWNYRQNLLYEEIETLKPDILCLQVRARLAIFLIKTAI